MKTVKEQLQIYNERLLKLELDIYGNGHPGLVKEVFEVRKDLQEIKEYLIKAKVLILVGVPVATWLLNFLVYLIVKSLFIIFR